MSELDTDFRRVMIGLTLLSHGSTQSWNADRVSGGEKSRQPTGESDPPQQQLWRRWMECRSDDQRWAVLGEFADLLEAWTKRSDSQAGDDTTENDWILEDGVGYEVEEVARRFNTTPSRVRSLRSKAGRDVETGKRIDGTVPKDNSRDRILYLAGKGCTNRQIELQTAVPRETVRRILKRAA